MKPSLLLARHAGFQNVPDLRANRAAARLVQLPSTVECSFGNVMQSGGASTGGEFVPGPIGSLASKASGSGRRLRRMFR